VSIEHELRKASHYLDLYSVFGHETLLERAREILRAVNATEARRTAVTVRPPMRLAA
jgi:hypothetical protein